MVFLIHQSVKTYLGGRTSHISILSGPGQVYRIMFVWFVEAILTERVWRHMYGLYHLGIIIDDVKVP